MKLLERYILSVFMRQTFMMLMGLSAVFSVFDLLASAGEVTADADNTMRALFDYMVLRFPSLFVLAVPMAVLLGTLSTMAKMARTQEMVVAGGAGYTILHVARILMAGAAFFSFLQFCAAELVVPSAASRLRLWQESAYAARPPARAPVPEKLRWARHGNIILHFEYESHDGRTLFKPVLVRLDEEGIIESYTKADKAIYREDGTWLLQNLQGEGVSGGDFALAIPLAPEDFSNAVGAIEETGFLSLWLDNRAGGELRALWLQRKLAGPIGTILMAFLAAPMGLLTARSGGMMLAGFGFIAAGFSFFVTERLLFAMGQAGTLPAFLAAWAPLLLFGTMSLWFILHKQE